MPRKNYRVDEVVRALSKKGCVITLENPITKTVNDLEYKTHDEIEKKFGEWLGTQNKVKQTADVFLMGEKSATDKWFNLFKKSHRKFLEPKSVRREMIIQQPYTVNIYDGVELGNGSWGKIDYLVNHQDFKLINQDAHGYKGDYK